MNKETETNLWTRVFNTLITGGFTAQEMVYILDRFEAGINAKKALTEEEDSEEHYNRQMELDFGGSDVGED